MADVWSDPTAAGAIYLDPTAPVYIAPIMLTEPDPVYRDDALFASSSANWRPAPLPPPPVPILNEAGELVLVVEPPTPAELRTQAVDALHAPAPGGPVAVASRGGARSTYSAPSSIPATGRGQSAPSRPAGSVTSSPATWLPDQGSSVPPPPAPSGWRPSGGRGPWRQSGGMASGPLRNMPTPTVPWRAAPPPPTWQPAPLAAPTRPTTAWNSARPAPGEVTYRAQARAARSGRSSRPGRTSKKAWIPALIVLAFVVVANVAPHLGGLFGSHKAPAAVTNAVNSYYTNLEQRNVTGADALICDARRTTFIAGSKQAGSDVSRGITDHKITSSRSDGSGKYTVHVNVTDKAGTSAPATITVVHEDGTYQLCGGTSP